MKVALRRRSTLLGWPLLSSLTVAISLLVSRDTSSISTNCVCQNQTRQSSVDDHHNGSLHHSPSIAWLASFPNSGTSYTLRLARDVTQLTTATNYGHEHVDTTTGASILLQTNWTAGPFRANQSQSIPKDYILTKTHCGSRCVHCAPDGYLETQRTFLRACLTAKRMFSNGSSIQDVYSPSMVERMVHLIRNPMDNVVARFHLSRRHHDKNKSTIANNASGFRKWCQQFDSSSYYQRFESHTPWLDPSLLRLWHKVPCHAEFFKYIQWHNLATSTATHLGIPVHRLRYEDYTNDWTATVKSLLEFLHQKPIHNNWKNSVTPFEQHSYPDYFTPAERRSIATFVKEVASAQVWDIVKEYFSGIIDN